jgi:ribosomal protein S18 acetylase RimI-like enzyme
MSDIQRIEILACDDWSGLRDIRLSALLDSPNSFLATHEQESGYDEQRWRTELARGRWHIGLVDGKRVSLLGATREPGRPAYERFLEYLWVSPGSRGQGVGLRFFDLVLGRLQAAGVRTVFLWVLDGNDVAVRLYRKAGFEPVGQPVPLTARPGRSEQLFRLELAGLGRRLNHR